MKNYDRFLFLEKLSEYGTIFKALYELGQAKYDSRIQTACVMKDNDGQLYFLINYDFFWSLNETEQLFLVAHEALHIYFNHLKDIEVKKLNPTIANIAMDIVINETLTTHFGFHRDLMPISKSICFIDTVFNDEIIKKYNLDLTKGYKYFYDILIKEIKNKNQEVIKNIKSNKSIDQHNPSESLNNPNRESELSNNEQFENKNSSILNINDDDNNNSQHKNDSSIKNNQNGQNEKSENKQGQNENNGKLDSHFQQNHDVEIFEYSSLNENDIQDLIESIENELDIDLFDLEKKLQNQFKAGNNNGFFDIDAILSKKIQPTVVKQPKWKKIIKMVNPSVLDYKEIENPSFAADSIPFLFTLDNGMIMAGIKEDNEISKYKATMYFFFDISGSCLNYLNDFKSIIEKIPQNLFKVKLYAFDNKVHDVEFDYKNKLFKTKFKVGGGTNFTILQKQIEKDLLDKKILKYPDIVCVITDGMATQVKNIPDKKQKNWIWLITPFDPKISKQLLNFLKKTIPFYDNEFSLDKPKINKNIKKGCKIYPLDKI